MFYLLGFATFQIIERTVGCALISCRLGEDTARYKLIFRDRNIAGKSSGVGIRQKLFCDGKL